jgi:chromate reductase
MEFTEISIGELPLYSQDFDDDFPAEAVALKQAIGTAVAQQSLRAVPSGENWMYA